MMFPGRSDVFHAPITRRSVWSGAKCATRSRHAILAYACAPTRLRLLVMIGANDARERCGAAHGGDSPFIGQFGRILPELINYRVQ